MPIRLLFGAPKYSIEGGGRRSLIDPAGGRVGPTSGQINGWKAMLNGVTMHDSERLLAANHDRSGYPLGVAVPIMEIPVMRPASPHPASYPKSRFTAKVTTGRRPLTDLWRSQIV